MTYNVFGGTLNLMQSINHNKDVALRKYHIHIPYYCFDYSLSSMHRNKEVLWQMYLYKSISSA